MARLVRVYKNVMAPLNASEYPAIVFKLFDELLAIHGGYYTYGQKAMSLRKIIDRTSWVYRPRFRCGKLCTKKFTFEFPFFVFDWQ